ncbi:MAG: hypothetical protein ACFFAK_12380 [Promethearchaeota archaeon]
MYIIHINIYIYEKPIKIKLLKSLLKGEEKCEVAIYIPQEDLR